MGNDNYSATLRDHRRRYRIQRLRYRAEAAQRGHSPSRVEPMPDRSRGMPATEAADWKEKFARAVADIENVRKRAQKREVEARNFAIQRFVETLIPALDSFDHALAVLDASHDPNALAEGMTAIRQQMHSALESQGIERIDALGEVFDPEIHEALSVEKTKKHPQNTVIGVMQTGYRLNGRLVRAARVTIAQKP